MALRICTLSRKLLRIFSQKIFKNDLFLAKKSGKITILGYLFKNIFQLWIFSHFDWPFENIVFFKTISLRSKKKLEKKYSYKKTSVPGTSSAKRMSQAQLYYINLFHWLPQTYIKHYRLYKNKKKNGKRKNPATPRTFPLIPPSRLSWTFLLEAWVGVLFTVLHINSPIPILPAGPAEASAVSLLSHSFY